MEGSPETTLVLNADDPVTATLGFDVPNPVVWYGLEAPCGKPADAPGEAEIKTCMRCGAALQYHYVNYAHLGGYRCPDCGLERPTPDVAVTSILELGADGSRVMLRSEGLEQELYVNLPALYNVSNAAGCVAASVAMGLGAELGRLAVEHFRCGFGRMEKFELGAGARMILIKNAAGCNQVLDFLARQSEPFRLLFVTNNRPADGTDVRWLADANFALLPTLPLLADVTCAGICAEEVQAKLLAAGYDPDKLTVETDYAALAALVSDSDVPVFILPSYTGMMEFRPYLARLTGGAEFWERYSSNEDRFAGSSFEFSRADRARPAPGLVGARARSRFARKVFLPGRSSGKNHKKTPASRRAFSYAVCRSRPEAVSVFSALMGSLLRLVLAEEIRHDVLLDLLLRVPLADGGDLQVEVVLVQCDDRLVEKLPFLEFQFYRLGVVAVAGVAAAGLRDEREGGVKGRLVQHDPVVLAGIQLDLAELLVPEAQLGPAGHLRGGVIRQGIDVALVAVAVADHRGRFPAAAAGEVDDRAGAVRIGDPGHAARCRDVHDGGDVAETFRVGVVLPVALVLLQRDHPELAAVLVHVVAGLVGPGHHLGVLGPDVGGVRGLPAPLHLSGEDGDGDRGQHRNDRHDDQKLRQGEAPAAPASIFHFFLPCPSPANRRGSPL